MTWNRYNVGTSAADIDSDIITDCIELLKGAARAHETDFPNATATYVNGIANAIDAENFAVSFYRPEGENQNIEQTFFFQKALTLTNSLRENIWIVSYGFLQTLVDPADQWEPQEFRDFIRNNMTDEMNRFRLVNGLDFLFSIDSGHGPLHGEANPLGRKIGCLQVHGAGDQWEATEATLYRGEDWYHQHWGTENADEKHEFTLTRIRRK